MTGENLLVNHRPSVAGLPETGDKKRKISQSSMDNPAFTIDENSANSFNNLPPYTIIIIIAIIIITFYFSSNIFLYHELRLNKNESHCFIT